MLAKKKYIFQKERQIFPIHIKPNKAHLSNVVFAKSTRASTRFPKLN